MGQLLDREEPEQFALTENGEQEIDKNDLPSIPRGSTTVYGLQECRHFLDYQLLQPLQYRRGILANPPVSSANNTHYHFPSMKTISLLGRASNGKRSLINEVCEKHSIHVKILSTPRDLIEFELQKTLETFDKVHTISEVKPAASYWTWSKNTAPTIPSIKIPEFWILVIESSVIADNSGSTSGHDRSFLLAKLNQIMTFYQHLSLDSSLIKIIFLLHEPHAIAHMSLGNHVSSNSAMYARVPPYEARQSLIRDSLNKFHNHDLIKRMNNLVTFEKPSVLDDLYNASAWYTPAEIYNFLDRCYNNVLIALVSYMQMTAIPFAPIDLATVFSDELELTRGAILNKSALNQVPVHPTYGPRPYALDLHDIRSRSVPFENMFQLIDVDIEDIEWIKIISPFVAKQTSRKRQIEEDVMQQQSENKKRSEEAMLHPSLNTTPSFVTTPTQTLLSETITNNVFIVPNKRPRLANTINDTD